MAALGDLHGHHDGRSLCGPCTVLCWPGHVRAGAEERVGAPQGCQAIEASS